MYTYTSDPVEDKDSISMKVGTLQDAIAYANDHRDNIDNKFIIKLPAALASFIEPTLYTIPEFLIHSAALVKNNKYPY
jgi:hypothetical protein